MDLVVALLAEETGTDYSGSGAAAGFVPLVTVRCRVEDVLRRRRARFTLTAAVGAGGGGGGSPRPSCWGLLLEHSLRLLLVLHKVLSDLQV